MAYNRLANKFAQGMPAGMPPEMGGGDPMSQQMQPSDPSIDGGMGQASSLPADGSQPPQKFTMGTLSEFLNADPDSAMQYLKSKVSNGDIQTPEGPTEAWSLFEPEDWRNADDATKGTVLGHIMDLLPVEMKAEQNMAQGDEMVMNAPIKTHKIEASVLASNEAIRAIAARLASPRKVASTRFNSLSRKVAQAKPVETYQLFESSKPTVDARTGQLLTQRDIVERNKGFGIKPSDPLSVAGVDFDTLWQQNFMDKFYAEHRDKDGRWVGGYINDRFEVDRTDNTLNNYQLKPGEKRKPYLPQYSSTEARLEYQREQNGVEGAKVFNWHEAKSRQTVKVAEEKIAACKDCGVAMPKAIEADTCSVCSRSQAQEDRDAEALGEKKK